MDSQKIRQDFPIFSSHPKLIYFDSACTSLKPMQVIDAEREYYVALGACAGRSAHSLAKKTSEKFESSREKTAKFVGAKSGQLTFTKNTTEGLNLVIRGLNYSKRKKIVTTVLEHHSLLVPILEQQRRGIAQAQLLVADAEGKLPMEEFESAIDSSTALVAIHHTNNTLGTSPQVEKIVKLAHDNGALLLLDAAQGVPHCQVDFRKLGVDFMAFSGHKMLGPTGIGCLVGKEEAVSSVDTFITGGETVETVSGGKVQFKGAPKRFEGGIQNYAGAIGLAAACDYLSKIGMKNIEEHEKRMAGKLIEAISSIPGSTIYGPRNGRSSSLVAFNLKGVAPHQVALMCDSLSSIALRSGVFCAQMAMEALGAKEGAVRASLYLYNTEKEIEIFRETLEKISKLG